MRFGSAITRFVGLRKATWVQAISDAIAQEALSIRVPQDRIVRIPNGVDVAHFRPTSGAEKVALRRSLELPQGRVIVLFVGRFSDQKGIRDLIEIWEREPPSATSLVAVGSGQTINPAGPIRSTRDLIVRPWTDRVVDYYRAADAFVLPSYVEGMSNALLEAMACGLPAIATRVGASGSLIQHGRNGFLFDPGDKATLKELLVLVAASPETRVSLGDQARRDIMRAYSVGHVVDAILKAARLEDPRTVNALSSDT